jgi:hypothetical protein
MASLGGPRDQRHRMPRRAPAPSPPVPRMRERTRRHTTAGSCARGPWLLKWRQADGSHDSSEPMEKREGHRALHSLVARLEHCVGSRSLRRSSEPEVPRGRSLSREYRGCSASALFLIGRSQPGRRFEIHAVRACHLASEERRRFAHRAGTAIDSQRAAHHHSAHAPPGRL